MEIVAEMPESRVEGFLAAGHAATITGWGVFEPFVARHRVPVVVAGFEPLDILAGLVRLVELIHDGQAAVDNMFPRCVTREGNLRAQEQLWRVFRPIGGRWRGIAHVPNGNLRLRDEWAHLDARRQFRIDLESLWDFAPPALAQACICGDIMAGIKAPTDCSLFGNDLRSRVAGRRVHGQQRGDLQDLASIRRASGLGRAPWRCLCAMTASR